MRPSKENSDKTEYTGKSLEYISVENDWYNIQMGEIIKTGRFLHMSTCPITTDSWYMYLRHSSYMHHDPWEKLSRYYQEMILNFMPLYCWFHMTLTMYSNISGKINDYGVVVFFKQKNSHTSCLFDKFNK